MTVNPGENVGRGRAGERGKLCARLFLSVCMCPYMHVRLCVCVYVCEGVSCFINILQFYQKVAYKQYDNA